jgi:futalosine hydrolase
MKPVLVIAAVPLETALLEGALENRSPLATGSFNTLEGTLGALRVVICTGGIGKINAAIAATAMIERLQPQLVINTGCAGAYPGSGLAIGDLAMASEEILGDEGVITSAGWLDFQAMGLPLLVQGDRRYYNEIPLPPRPADLALQLANRCGTQLTRGRFVTVSTCSGSDRRGVELGQRFRAIAENMEGAAVALTCLRYGIDCLEIRGISNLVEERDMKRWDIPRAVEVAQRFVLKYLEEMVRPLT